MKSTNWNYLDINNNHQVHWLIENNAGAVGDDLMGFFEPIIATQGALFKP